MKTSKLILALIPFLILGCKSKQQLFSTQAPKHEAKVLIEKALQAEPKFSTANVSKMNMAVTVSDHTYNTAVSCRIKTDSAVFISIMPVFGYEVFRVQATPDSIKLFDKMNKKMYALDYGFFNTKYGVNVDFNSLQALISNRFFKLGTKDISAKECLANDSVKTFDQIIYENGDIRQTVQLNDSSRIVKINLTSAKLGSEMWADYANFATFDSISFPQEISLKASKGKTKFNCDFSITKLAFNQKVNLTPLDESRYERDDISRLLKK